MQHFEQAAEYFRGEESHSSANKNMLKVRFLWIELKYLKCQYIKVAEYAATLENYDKAIKIYEQVAAASLENNLLKYAAKEHFFRASLCHLCVDALNAQHAVQKWDKSDLYTWILSNVSNFRYEEQYPAFGDSREAKLIKVLGH